MSVSWAGALLVETLFLNSELVAGAVTELLAAEKVATGEERVTLVDTGAGVMG